MKERAFEVQREERRESYKPGPLMRILGQLFGTLKSVTELARDGCHQKGSELGGAQPAELGFVGRKIRRYLC